MRNGPSSALPSIACCLHRPCCSLRTALVVLVVVVVSLSVSLAGGDGRSSNCDKAHSVGASVLHEAKTEKEIEGQRHTRERTGRTLSLMNSSGGVHSYLEKIHLVE